jgi:nucleotide-binding universal stress UspA family protein
MVKHILVAVGTSLSDAALTAALRCARESNARLTAMHVVDQTPWWAVVTADCSTAETLAVIDGHGRAVARHCMRRIEKAGVEGSAFTLTLPLYANLGETIARASIELGADLIVLGGEADIGWRHGDQRLRDVVCAHAKCNVLIASHLPVQAESAI